MRPPGFWSDSMSLLTTSLGSTSYTKSWSYPNGTSGTGAFGSNARSWSKQGYNDPSYWSLVAQGLPVPPHLATHQRFKRQHVDPCVSQENYPGTYWSNVTRTVYYNGAWIGADSSVLNTYASTLDASTLKALSGSAIRGLRKKVRGTDFNSLAFAGELGESVRMISSRSKMLADGIVSRYSAGVSKADALRRELTSRNSGRKTLKRVSDYWLESCYGWRPLFNDMDNAAKAAANYVEGHGAIYSKLQSKLAEPYYLATRGTAVAMSANYSAAIQREDLVTHAFGCTRSQTWMNRSLMCSALQTVGVSWDSVLPTVWELIPYSFVVDALTNSSDIIDAVSCPISGIINPWKFFIEERNLKVQYKHILSGGATGNTGVGFYYEQYFNFLRAPSTAIAEIPDLTFRDPSLGSMVNLAALATSRIVGMKKLLSFR